MLNHEITVHEEIPIAVDDLTIVLTARGHRITSEGDRNLATLTLKAQNLEALEIPLSADGDEMLNQEVAFGPYRIRLLTLSWNGMTVTLLVTKE